MSFDPTKNSIFSNDLRHDEAAFEAFFKKNFTPLCSYCQYKFGFDLDGAKEIVHTAFVRLWETRQQLAGELSPLAYLRTSIINSSLDVLKHEKVKQKHATYLQNTAPGEPAESNYNSVDYKQLQTEIDNAVAELPEQMRRIFILSRFEGLKYAAIAGELNISVKTVETQMSRALAKLRERLAGYLTVLLLLVLWHLLADQ